MRKWYIYLNRNISMNIPIQNDPYMHARYTTYISMEICGH